MGSLLLATCTCGYEKETASGAGMRMTFSAPALCPSCEQVITLHSEGIIFDPIAGLEPDRCPTCQTLAKTYDLGPGDDLDADLMHPCPKCGQKEMRFVSIGLWD
jgi:predicted RNA-binding Zn-ribbon protein involved in translation (DUF1610 family)